MAGTCINKDTKTVLQTMTLLIKNVQPNISRTNARLAERIPENHKIITQDYIT